MLRQLFAVVDPSTRRLVLAALGAVAGHAVLKIAAIALLLPVLDALLGVGAGSPSDVDGVSWRRVGVAVAVALVAIGVDQLAGRLTILASHRAATAAMTALIRHTARLPLGRLDGPGRQEIAGLFTETRTTVVNALRQPVPVVWRALATTLAAAVAALWVAPWVAFVVIVSAAGVVAAGLAMEPRIQRGAVGSRRARGSAVGELVEYAQAQPALRAFTGFGSGSERVRATLSSLRDSERTRVNAVLAGTSLLPEVITGAAFGAVALLGVILGTGPAELIVALFLVLVQGNAMLPFMRAWIFAGHSGHALARVRAELAEPPLPEPVAPALPAPDSLDLRFEDVSFGYRDDQPVLGDVTFTAPVGSLTAIVGPSGAGKSTLLRLAARFWDTGAGRITLGGIDLRAIGSAGVLDRVAIVFQDAYLIAGTLRENLLLARSDATDSQLAEVARDAALDEVIDVLPDGWDTPVGEGGASLSGGQRQRVALARALLKKSPVLLVDEAAAALDGRNENRIGELLYELARDRTVVTVTHRLHSVTRAGRIVVLDGGRVAETGHHEELMDRGGLYARLWEAQSRPRPDPIDKGATR